MLIKVDAYQCSFCHKLFKKSYQHKACKSNPDVIHCGDCVNYRHYTGNFDSDGEFTPPCHYCTKGLMSNNVPRKDSCASYVHTKEKEEETVLLW